MSTVKTVDQMSTQELEAYLAEKRKADKTEQDARRYAYEQDRNELVESLLTDAEALSGSVAYFKQIAMFRLKKWLERMREYGEAKVAQQNVQLISNDGKSKVVYALQRTSGFDERSKIAEEKIRIFLENFIKKKDRRQYNLFMSFLEKNSVTGDLDVKNINKFYKFENDFPEYPEYKEACDLFKESYVEQGSKNYARFFKRDDNGTWKPIIIDFAAL